MRAEDCKEIQRQIEETDPGQQPAPSTMSHVRHCGKCLEFFERDMKLRQVVASLAPVEAPADFDFRLRARIANERVRTRRGFTFNGLSLGIPALTFGGLVLLAGLFFLLPGLRSTEVPVQLTTSPVNGDSRGTVKPALTEGIAGRGETPDVPAFVPPIKTKGKLTDAGRKQTLTFKRADRTEVKDSAVVGAMVVRPESSATDAQIPLSFPLQTLTVSVEDGSGESRTISFPTVSFGSQRVLTNGGVRPGLNPAVKRVW